MLLTEKVRLATLSARLGLAGVAICMDIILQCPDRFLGCLGLVCSYLSWFWLQTHFQPGLLGGLVCYATLKENPFLTLR
jgi:hypothetical protein